MSPPESHRHGVAAVVLREDKFLVIRRGLSVVAPGALCFPGGGVELGESEPEALVRELREELAVEVTPMQCLWRSVTPWHVSIAWWQATVSDTAHPISNPAEVQSFGWLTPQEMLACSDLLQSNRHFLLALAVGSIHLQR